MRKIRQANHLLDELTRALETNKTQLSIANKELDSLNDGFQDKEKSNDKSAETAKVQENDGKNVELFKERDTLKSAVGKQEETLNTLDPSKASIEDFNAVLKQLDVVTKMIQGSLEKAQGLGKSID